ncbi:hypothetical protein KIPE111705_07100 [Kibdelosporangium persicum]
MQLSLLIAGVTLCAAASAGIYTDHLADQRAQVAALRAEAELAEGQILPRTPSEAVRSLHSLISYAGDRASAGPACSLMTPLAQREFAAVYRQPNCLATAHILQAQVTDRTKYPRFRFTDQDQVIQGDHGTMDGCAITWRSAIDPAGTPDPGPRLGRFTLHRIAGLGFKITGVTPCASKGSTATPDPRPTLANTPPAGSASSRPPAPPMSRPTGLLPSYAPSVPAILAGRIAMNDPGACELFTAAGRAQFAAAHKAADCPAAVAVMRAQVVNPTVYRNPHTITTQTTDVTGRTVVDGCRLKWSTWAGPTVPGPQIGHLELEHPPGSVGYLIAGYTPC